MVHFSVAVKFALTFLLHMSRWGFFVILFWLFCVSVCFATKKSKIHKIGHAINGVVVASPRVYPLFTTFQQKLQFDYSFSSQNVLVDCQVSCVWFLPSWLFPGLADCITNTHALSLSYHWFPAVVMALHAIVFGIAFH